MCGLCGLDVPSRTHPTGCTSTRLRRLPGRYLYDEFFIRGPFGAAKIVKRDVHYVLGTGLASLMMNTGGAILAGPMRYFVSAFSVDSAKVQVIIHWAGFTQPRLLPFAVLVGHTRSQWVRRLPR